MTRVTSLPAKASVRDLITGMPPATAASNRKTELALSAFMASAWPWWASKALLAVTTSLPAARAASVAAFAGPSWPPISSTNTSTSSRWAKATGSLSHAYPSSGTPRSLSRLRAEMALIVIGRPVRCSNSDAFWRMIFTTPMPTVPSPAIPRRKGCVIKASVATSHVYRDVASSQLLCNGRQ